jgi:hypothetical protein
LKLGDEDGGGMTSGARPAGRAWMGLVLQLVERGAGSQGGSIDVLELDRPRDLRDIANLGLTLAEARQLLTGVQQAVVAVQARDHAALRPECSGCGARCHVKDWQLRQVATLFGTLAIRLPRFRCPECGRSEAGISWPAYCRSSPELDRLQAHLSALLTYRVATGVLAYLRPGRATRSCAVAPKLGEQPRRATVGAPKPAPVSAAPAAAISFSLDFTYIRSCHAGERPMEVRVGNAEVAESGACRCSAPSRTPVPPSWR